MIAAFFLSIGQLGDRSVLRVLLYTAILSLLTFVGAGWLLFLGFNLILGQTFSEWHNASGLAGLLAVLATVFGAWLLWRIVAIAILQLFADQIIDAVEKKHYPAHAHTAQGPNWQVSVRLALKSLGRAVGYNALALPVYGVLLFTGIGAPVVFLLVNAILVGRDLSEMVEVRHASAAELPRHIRFLLGLVANMLLLVPIVNLLGPIIAACMATHLVNRQMIGQRDQSAETKGAEGVNN
jgi:CysZ protein